MANFNGSRKIVFDIETIGVDFNALDKDTQNYLFKSAITPEEQEKVKAQLNFWPLTAQVAAIAMLNPDTGKGAVYFQSGGKKLDIFEEEGIEYVSGSEEEALKNFWHAAAAYDQFITFNGRSFDAPFLITRSAINKIVPTKNLMPYRYGTDVHIDLMDQLTFYRATSRAFSLDFYAKSFGIKSPKGEGVDGSKVGELYKNGEYARIARYCMGDARATAQLYEVWQKYFNIR